MLLAAAEAATGVCPLCGGRLSPTTPAGARPASSLGAAHEPIAIAVPTAPLRVVDLLLAVAIFLVTAAIALTVTLRFGAGDALLALLIGAFFAAGGTVALHRRRTQAAPDRAAPLQLGVTLGVAAALLGATLRYAFQVFDRGQIPWWICALAVAFAAWSTVRVRTNLWRQPRVARDESDVRESWWYTLLWSAALSAAAYGAYRYFTWFESQEEPVMMCGIIAAFYRLAGKWGVVLAIAALGLYCLQSGLQKLVNRRQA